jgi:Histidine kinase-, DNA gyrase B-, and HSP90-like ATPase
VPTEYRTIRIADMGAALRLLSEVYSDARRALSEFISNSADAFVLGERQGIRRNWSCELYLSPKEIKVLDNGPGITRERLLELPSHITLSAKSGDWQQKGYKAIGLLAYGSFCKEMRIVSRAEGEQETFEAYWTCESLTKPEEHPVRVDLADPERRLKTSGTAVILSGIFDDRLHQLKAQKLVDFLKAEFSPDLRAKRYDLLVFEGKVRYQVLPGRYSGIPFPKLSLQTRENEKIEIELYLTQKPLMQRVALFVRGKQILANLGELQEFADGPWKSGRVAGEVRSDFLHPTTGRTAIEHGEEWKRFVDALKSIEDEIQSELDKIAEEQRAREATRVFKEINQALASVLPSLRWDELPKSAVGSGDADLFPPGRDGVGPSGGKGKARTKGQGAPPISPRRSRLIDPSRPKKAGGSAATGFNYREAEFEADQQSLRSRYITVQSLIEVNSSHSDYVSEREEDRRFKEYLMLLVVKEIALLNFKDMGENEVAERFVELQTALHRAGV